MKENGQEEQIQSFDDFWDDDPRQRRHTQAPRRLSQFIIGGIVAFLLALLMLFMFGDRQPPEKPKSKNAELVIPLDNPESAPGDASGQQPVPALSAAPEEAAPVYPQAEPGASRNAANALPAESASHSTMDVRRNALQAPKSTPALVPYERGMAPRPAERPEAAASQAGTERRLNAAVPPASVTRPQNDRESGLQARLARETRPDTPVAMPGTSVTNAQAHHFLVQLGAFKTRENADKLVQSLGGNGPMKLRVVEDAAKGVFKVQSGPYGEAGQARQAREQIMQKATSLQPIILPMP